MNEPGRWTFRCIWYENRRCRVHEIEHLCFRSSWLCVYSSFYGSELPMSTRITVLWVLTSFVPPVHNQGISLAPLQSHVLWKIFLPTTGVFCVISLTDLHDSQAGALRWTFPSFAPHTSQPFLSWLDSAPGINWRRLSPTVTGIASFYSTVTQSVTVASWCHPEGTEIQHQSMI